jgi:hypothetical protein
MCAAAATPAPDREIATSNHDLPALDAAKAVDRWLGQK